MPRDLIKKLEKEIKRLKDLAYKDELTHLLNRRGFQEVSSRFLKEAIASKKYKDKRKSVIVENFGLVIFDIDNFKKINDRFGHNAGDEVIKKLAETILKRVRAIDVAARWGGEEFIVGLVGASEDDSYVIADDIREKIENTKINWRRKKIHFTVSGGATDLNKKRDFADLLNAADKALYKAKRSGKNRIIRASEL